MNKIYKRKNHQFYLGILVLVVSVVCLAIGIHAAIPLVPFALLIIILDYGNTDALFFTTTISYSTRRGSFPANKSYTLK